jgi:hypothetical protein
MPGGGGGYPAFWIRDFAMSLDSGLISPEEMLAHLRLVARNQNGREVRHLRNGLEIPPFAIPDHINFDGAPVFFPGSYSSGEDQGDSTYGSLPPLDDNYEFIHIAWCLFRAKSRTEFLRETINGKPLQDRLSAAFEVPQIESASGLVITDARQRAVGFGFCDAICLTGKLLFASLLRYRAAGELAELAAATHQPDRRRELQRLQQQLARSLVPTFSDPERIEGWLMAATETGRQPDVWGTLYASRLKAIQGAAARRAVDVIVGAVKSNTIIFEGAVRHLPTNYDFAPGTAWEKTAGVARNRYQNGAYWHTPTGWLITTVQGRDPALASRIFADYMAHLRREDFRGNGGRQGPWECFAPGGYRQNGIYLTSVTVPYAVLMRR